MNGRAAAWAALVGAGVGYEFHQLREQRTHPAEAYPLSRGIRVVFRVDTRPGRAVFVTCVASGATWLVQHIIREAGAVVVDALDGEHGQESQGALLPAP